MAIRIGVVTKVVSSAMTTIMVNQPFGRPTGREHDENQEKINPILAP